MPVIMEVSRARAAETEDMEICLILRYVAWATFMNFLVVLIVYGLFAELNQRGSRSVIKKCFCTTIGLLANI